MLLYILRRLGLGVLTILGVLLITFVLFRVVAGDIAAANLGERASETKKAEWRHRHGYDMPAVVNYHQRLLLTDHTMGPGTFSAQDIGGSAAGEALALVVEEQAATIVAPPAAGPPASAPASSEPSPATEPSAEPASAPADATEAEGEPQEVTVKTNQMLTGRYVGFLGPGTEIAELTRNLPLVSPPRVKQGHAAGAVQTRPAEAPASIPATAAAPPKPQMVLRLADGAKLAIDVAGIATAGDLIDRINQHPDNHGRVTAGFTSWHWPDFFNSQFFRHMLVSVTFDARSLKDNQKLTEIIGERAPASLAIQIPALALEFMIGMAIACFVAYYRGSLLDKAGVFLSVLGMCIPFLAFMIYGQWAMFVAAPKYAYGTFYRANVYVPIAIMVVAGLGGMVRFYRTIILDETGRDYVRTAKAKGLSLPAILFKHVLRNCMLPMLTSLILAIPFMIMGNLLVESYFGVPGLGDLMLTSIYNRNEPVLNGLVFLTSLIYTVGILLTDISYAVFDPRIRLK